MTVQNIVNRRPYTTDPELLRDPEYKIVESVIRELDREGILKRLSQECIAAADILQHELGKHGISSRIMECQASVFSTETNKPLRGFFVGFDEDSHPGGSGIDTHVVLVTETKTPMLIDLSLSGLMPVQNPWIVEPVEIKDTAVWATYYRENLRITYMPKRKVKLVTLHSRNLLSRLSTELEVKTQLKWLKIAVVVVLTLVSLNFVRGAYDWYQTYIVDSNAWGPDHNKRVIERLDRLENNLINKR